MKKYSTIFLLFYSIFSFAQPTVNAGTDKTINRDAEVRFVKLVGTASGTGTLNFAWSKVTTSSDSTYANIHDGTNDTTDVRQLPYNGTTGWNFNLKVTDDIGTTADEIKVNTVWGFWPPQLSDFQIADASDTTNINVTLGMGIGYCKIGDLIIDGANDGWDSAGYNTDIYMNAPSILTTNPLGPGENILINGSRGYRNIQLIFGSGQCNGAAGNPVTIKSYGTKLRPNSISISGYATYLTMDGNMPGFRGFTQLNYAFSSGTFGIEVDGRWANILGVGLYVDATNIDYFEAKNIEIHGGHFAASQVISSDATDTIFGFKFHHNYVHHSHSEGFYFNRTSAPSAVAVGWEIYDNVFSYTGSEISQFVYMNHDNIQRNNVFFCSAINRYSMFQESQDFGPSFGPINGRNTVRDNLAVGAGEQMINYIMSNPAAYNFAKNGDKFYILNNAWLRGCGHIGTFFGYPATTPDSMFIHLDSNIFGRFNFQADKYFIPADNRATNTMHVIRVVDNTFPIYVHNTIRDATKTTLVSDASNADTAGTKVYGLVPNPEFANSGWTDDFAVELITQYCDTIGDFHNDEWDNPAMKQGDPRINQIGDIVMDFEKYYRCKVANLHHKMPQGVTDSDWELLTWPKPGGGISYLPPDDLRLKKGSFYQLRGIGLTQFVDLQMTQFIELRFGKNITFQ